MTDSQIPDVPPPSPYNTKFAPEPTNSRQLAWVLLEKYRLQETFISRAADKYRNHETITDRDRIQAVTLAENIVRRKLTLDAVLQKLTERSRDEMEPELWSAMQIGAAQLIFQPHIPPHAAINETVNLAEWQDKPRWTNFLNGVLRGTQRLTSTDQTDQPAQNAVPITGGTYLLLNENIFSNPEDDLVRYLSVAFSLPRPMIRRWSKKWTLEELTPILFRFLSSGFHTFRVNQTKTDRETLLPKISAAGFDAHAGTHPLAIHLCQPAPLSEIPGFNEGELTVQDETSMNPVTLLAPSPNEKILDLCAAPGTKTTQIAEAMQDTGTVIATDTSANRLKKIDENAIRLNLNTIQSQVIEPDAITLPEAPFDRILVDAPCSNSGVLGKRPEARWRFSVNDIQQLTEIQTDLLTRALKAINPKGTVVYSTCSIEPEENSLLVKNVLASFSENEEYTLIKEELTLPSKQQDGGYAARIDRIK